MRTTPENITVLNDNEVFVFGSNLKGIHGAGAARAALSWGATVGVGYGLRGQTFAIPTKDHFIETLSVELISECVESFISFAESTPELTYLVTEIGCGLAGYSPEDIAPLFKKASEIKNIHLPERFWKVINNS
jgi:hypothetical protein